MISRRGKRVALTSLVAAGLMYAELGMLAAQEFPSRAIEFIVPWGPGGGADQLARKLGKLLESVLGVSVPVLNVPGATGGSGLAKLLAAPSDGYTMAIYIADSHALLAT